MHLGLLNRLQTLGSPGSGFRQPVPSLDTGCQRCSHLAGICLWVAAGLSQPTQRPRRGLSQGLATFLLPCECLRLQLVALDKVIVAMGGDHPLEVAPGVSAQRCRRAHREPAREAA